MAGVNRFDAALELFMNNYMRGVFSLLPCVITAINYDIPSVDLKPLGYDTDPNGQAIEISDILDVPYFVFGDEDTHISVPVKVGTRVCCILSDIDTTGIMTGSGAQPISFQKRNDLYPLLAIPSFFTPANPMSISSTDIDIKNKSADISIQPDGNIFANGCNITPDGNVITKKGTDLDAFYEHYTEHTHGGVDTGQGNTLKPNGV